ncbi:DMT family transporter [Acinetobacter bohemicus]|uniref:DMT family transporter n=1 Tax=Acinetobacter TaxID=469 RepID=UPI00209B396B|nr:MULTISPECIES: DMT family transporter [Acinetobacter]MCO8041493.1 DMT family transporter [Acinetobacter sp. S4400-12]MCU7223816.1 DMT family transporter [Acinetobacter bohemicus]
MPTPPTSHLLKAILLLTCSAFLFSMMGVCIRYASQTVDNATVVFFRNVVGLFIFLPLILNKGVDFFRTEKIWMHIWRSVVGLMAMYGFFYAIAHLKLSNAMVFTYSSPIFIPLIAWLFLKEKVTASMIVAASIGLVGVICVAKPDTGLFNLMAVIGLGASFLAAMAFVTVRALTQTEPPERIVFYFCLIGSLISVIPMFWLWRPYSLTELGYLIAAGLLANISQLFMSTAYKLAPAGQIGPVNYIAIVFAGLWGYVFWHEVPDFSSLLGLSLIFCAVLLCSPLLQSKLNRAKSS